jgi:HEPN domain-containing protein
LVVEKITYDRKLLFFLEDAYYNSRYIDYNYNEEDAKDALKIAEEVTKLVENFD